ncbi:dTDP-4-dehydrorhamnose reductase [Asticcacaulis tiandongensis]|uniref:dTDP-4-dehydrorhamnose reductase n=1 Tax=Asticcacaulis tiandongensis TaxID=2565365 RepID=UPI001FEB8721|nr:dTDP-4-dehydrorhamnose reductase [Asticcacaulis tiandongensis]
MVTGQSGQVVSALKAASARRGIDLVTLARPVIDLARSDSLRLPVLAAQPDVIISAAAYTLVDQAESEPELAMRVNAHGPAALAQLADELDIPLLHLSTDYVFDGRKAAPYAETDLPSPINIYGETKLAGEKAIAAATDNHVILRTSWVFSPYGNNFIKTMMRRTATHETIRVIDDQTGCPTYAPEIADALLEIASRVTQDRTAALRGIFHFTGAGQTSWAGLADALFREMRAKGLKAGIVAPISTAEYGPQALRPAHSVLDCQKILTTYDIKLAEWPVSVRRCLDQLVQDKA